MWIFQEATLIAKGGKIFVNSKLIPVANMGHSMIKQIKLLLNGSLITEASDDYAKNPTFKLFSTFT